MCADNHWYVVYTKSHQEEKACQNLERQGFECYFPKLCRATVQVALKSGRGIEPVFPRYIFLLADDSGGQDIYPVRSSRGVTSLVRFGQRLATVSAELVAGLKRRCDPETGLMTTIPVNYKAGDEVEVVDGALSGLKGVFQEFVAERRALLLIEFLGKQTPVQVNPLLLARA